ncbi:MAG: DNA oxidative demethylase AlkB [Enterobacteriaceae bacterium]
MIKDLFADDDSTSSIERIPLAEDAIVLRGFATEMVELLLQHIDIISSQAAFRHWSTPGGRVMSVSMTNCGALGWVSDRQGYRYTCDDPDSGKAWPDMPLIYRQLAHQAASEAGFAGFEPDACLINCYQPGSRLTLHQDKDEQNLSQPIVSVSLGLPAIFLFGGLKRSDSCQRITLVQGDVVVWGGASRLYYHGILPIKEKIPPWPLRESVRYNLTFRRVRFHENNLDSAGS